MNSPLTRRFGVTLILGIVVAELALVQPIARWGPMLVGDPMRFAAFVDLVRAAGWLGAVVIATGAFAIGRFGPQDAAPAEIPRKQRWLWLMLDTFSEGVVAFDHKGRVAFANQAALRLLQRRALPDGTPMAAFADVPKLRTTVATALLDGRMETVDLRTAGPPRRTLLARAAPCDDGAMLLLVDITEERAAVEAREAFLSDAAHELRTPVAGITMGLEALASGGIDDPVVTKSLVGGVERQAWRLQSLLDDLLSLARLESGAAPIELEPVHMGQAVQEVVELADEPERIDADGPDDLWVDADPVAIEQIVTNLVHNALRYTDATVRVRWVAGPRGARLFVEDQGPGLTDEQKEKVFDRFYRVDAGRSTKAGGTGLGLAIVRELVERCGGRVWVEDAVPHGARFVVELNEAAEPSGPREDGSGEPALA